MMIHNPMCLLGVCNARVLAPIPDCLGVPGMMILDAETAAILTANSALCVFAAVLLSIESQISQGKEDLQLTLLFALPSLSQVLPVSRTPDQFADDCPCHQSSFLGQSRTQIQAQLVKDW
jgi:hypothetical protein